LYWLLRHFRFGILIKFLHHLNLKKTNSPSALSETIIPLDSPSKISYGLDPETVSEDTSKELAVEPDFDYKRFCIF